MAGRQNPGFRVIHVGKCSRNARNDNIKHQGFTLVELLIAVGILSVIAAFSLGALRGVRSQAALKDGQALMLHAFERARSRAATGVGTSDHGVHIESDRIVSFEGASYAGDGETSYLPPGVISNQVSSTVVFKRLTAQSNADATITLSGAAGATSTIAVTMDGAIIPN